MKKILNLMIFLLFVSCNTMDTNNSFNFKTNEEKLSIEIIKAENKLYYQIGDLSKLQGGGFVHNVGITGLQDSSRIAVNQAWADFSLFVEEMPMLSVEGFDKGKQRGSMYMISSDTEVLMRSNENSSNWTVEMLDLGFNTYIVCDTRDKSEYVFNLEYKVSKIYDNLDFELVSYDNNGIPFYKVSNDIFLSEKDKQTILLWYEKRMLSDLEYEDCLSSSIKEGKLPFCGIAHIIRLSRMNRIDNFFLACSQEDLHFVSRYIAFTDWLCIKVGKTCWL
jgi:hypothetical protein